MPSEIMAKFKDAISMFWDSLAEVEKRYLVFLGVYFAAALVAGISARAEKQREEKTRELIEEAFRARR